MLYLQVDGFSSFEPYCTTPNTTVSYVGPPKIRGSLELVWTCTTVLIAGVYTVLHYDIPYNERQLQGFTNANFVRWLKCEIYFVPVLTVLAPELVYAASFIDWLDAWFARKAFNDHAKCAGTSWPLKHVLFMGMNGFILLYRSDTPASMSDHAGNKVSKASTWPHPSRDDTSIAKNTTSLSLPLPQGACLGKAEPEVETTSGLDTPTSDVCNPASMPPTATDWNKIMVPCDVTTALASGEYRAFHLNPDRYLRAIELGIIPPTPIATANIDTLAKSDAFAKVILIGSLFWFILNVAARQASGLPVSAFEVGTIAFAIFATLAYGFQFQKPRGAETPIALAVVQYVPAELRALSQADRWPVPRMQMLCRARRQVLVTYLLGSCFGAIHLAPWDMHFASTTDATLWRAATIIATVAPALSTLHMIVRVVRDHVRSCIEFCESPTAEADDQRATANIRPEYLPGTIRILNTWDRYLRIIDKITAIVGFPVLIFGYFPARVIIVVEMIRGLFFLPPEMFKVVNWVTVIPHVS